MCIRFRNLHVALYVCVSQGRRQGLAHICIYVFNPHDGLHVCVSQGFAQMCIPVLKL